MVHIGRVLPFVLVGLALGAPRASAQRSTRARMYQLTVLDGLEWTRPAGVNDLGRVTGVAGLTSPVGFVWSPAGGYAPLAPVLGTRSAGMRIDRAGFVVGTSFSPSTTWATLWNPAGTPLEIPLASSSQVVPNAINESGVVAGVALFPVGGWKGWVWDVSSGTRLLETLGLPAGATAMDVNDAGQVCGAVSGQAFVHDFDTGSSTLLGTLGGDWSGALGLSDRGHAVGWSSDPLTNEASPFVWTASAGMRSLGTPAGPGFAEGRALAVNDRGTVVGTLEVPGGTRAFVWDELSGMHDLNDVVRTGAIELRGASDVSDSGWITGVAVDSTSGETVGFVLKPM